MKTITVRGRPQRPWNDDDCRSSWKEARRLERKFHADKNPESRVRWRNALKNRKLFHSKSSSYWKNEINAAGGNARCVWRVVDGLLAESKSSSKVVFTPRDYHDYIDTKIAGVRAATATAHPPDFDRCSAPDNIVFNTINQNDVVCVIRTSLSQCVSDPLPTWLLKECADVVAPYITHIFNLSLVEGHFPTPWKHVIVTSLLKKAGRCRISRTCRNC